MSLAPPEGYVPGYRSRVSPSLYEEIFRRVYSGEKCKKIAPEYGVSGRTLQRIVRHMAKELGVPMNVWFEMKARRRREGWEFISVTSQRRISARFERAAAHSYDSFGSLLYATDVYTKGESVGVGRGGARP